MISTSHGMQVSRTLLVPGLAAVIGIAGLAAALLVSAGSKGEQLPIVGHPIDVVQQPIREETGQGWRVVNTTSAHRMLVVEVETRRVGEAVAIAQQIVAPVEERYDEVLVFFFDPRARPRRAGLRVQWTRAGGYRTLDLSPSS
jgi:hypothetical protein